MYKRVVCIALSAFLIISFTGCKKKTETNKVAVNTATNVTVAEVERKNIFSDVSYTGELKATETASVSSKVSAKVTSVNVKIGDYVTKGTTLVTLDSTDLQNAYNQAQAAYASAVATYENVANGSTEQSKIASSQSLTSAQTAYDEALKKYNRQKQLYDIGAISEVEFNAAQTELNTASANLESAKQSYNLTVDVVSPGNVKSAQASVNSAQAALNTAASNLDQTALVAPISGYVATSNVILGQMAGAGVELITIADSSSVDAEVKVTESVMTHIQVGTKATVNVSSVKKSAFNGTVSVVNPVKDAKTGLYTVKISIPNPDKKLLIGMMANITLVTDTAVNANVIPSEAILEDTKGNTFVYIAKGNKAVKKDVVLGISDDEFTEVVSGVRVGDKVIVKGKEYISEKNNEINITKEK